MKCKCKDCGIEIDCNYEPTNVDDMRCISCDLAYHHVGILCLKCKTGWSSMAQFEDTSCNCNKEETYAT